MKTLTKTEITRHAILAEGFSLLSRQGYNGTGLKQILDAVKIPKGSFYHYFDSKEQFAKSVIDQYVDHLLAIFDEHLKKNSGDPVCLIRSLYALMIKEFERTACAQGCLVGSLAAELGQQSIPVQQSLQRAYKKWVDRFQPLVIEAQKQNLMRTDISAEDISELFWCAWEGAILKMKITGSSSALHRVLTVTLDGLLQNVTRNV